MRSRIATVLAAGLLALAGCGGGDPAKDSGGSPAVEQTLEVVGVTLIAPKDAGSGRCLPPSAETLSGADVAFDGTVRSVEHGLVDLEVSRWYRGGEGDLATVRAQPGAMQDLIGAVAFDEGGRYLVAGTGSDLMVCGLSAPYDETLAGLYAEAFGG